MNARAVGLIDRAFEASLDHERVDPRLAPIFENMSLRRSYGEEPFGHKLAIAAEGVITMADEALDKYGGYHEPATAAAVADVRNLGVLIIAATLKGDASGSADAIANEEWLEAIRMHNRLADILEREAAKHYRELRIDVSLDRFFERSARIPYRATLAQP